ncbi:MAG: DUF2726 domain-containing protein, partial [Rhizobiaceae bacterium]|nr:DUF2726 domain-containing protein [Rhizobiaceae bacterium]
MHYDAMAWIDEYYALIIVLVGGLLIGMAAEQIRAAQRRRAWLERNGSRPPQRDSADQLRVVMRSDFFAQPLLNRGEARLFRELDRFVTARNPDWQVMAQVSLGEILRGGDAEAHSCINSKRVDLLIVNENCQPMHVIEYQGAGHYKGTAAARDAVKKEALR